MAGGGFFTASGSASATAVLARGVDRGFDVEALFLLVVGFEEEDFEVFDEVLEEDLDELLRERPVLPAIEI
ncbi:MAG: hypothetical protein DHS20C16_27780 [Phycisphaerae bacterium]|nr:MAG: hypothetical protein DHS20C16_27780 [Phycisphaerae bacterium]